MLAACDPAPIGTGCQFSASATSVRLNQNTAGGGDGNINIAALDGGSAWNNAHTDGPRITSYWPSDGGSPYGKGEFEVRSFTNAQSPNSGYTSTSGPSGGFVMPSCGSSSWSSKPHIWLNQDKINQRESIGRWNWNISVATHELGHAQGLADNENTACVDVGIMESTTAHGYVDCNVYAPRAGDIRTIDSLYS